MKYATEIDFSFNNTMTLFINNIKENSVVLEFGPASGRLTRYLKNEKKCRVYIVELDEEAGKAAAQWAEDFVIGDIQDFEWVKRFEGVSFDYILFADVLEHLTRAEEVMKRAAEMLAPDGRICVSVPNIAHNSVIIDLLKNKFDYTTTGLMDSTHVHFYTAASLDRFVSQCGLYVEKRCATYTQVGLNEFENTYGELPEKLANMLKTRKYGEVYQYVYIISKRPDAQNLDEIVKYSDYLYAQAFFDYGRSGYEEYKKWYIHADEKRYIYECGDISGAVKLRFDPENCPCSIKVIRAVGVEKGESEELEFDSCNAYFREGNIFYFDSDDAQLHYKLSKPHYDKIVIEAEHIPMSDIAEVMKGCIERHVQEQQEKERVIARQEECIDFFREFISRAPVNTLYKLYCKKNHRDVE